ncbi:hypothetical protein [Sphingobium indicum]|uniref:hypothetical protein n=1 Tax=Sphingobium indicum TaxID=332055 RepID=UPI00041D7717|nr:hypothetical protein [Sphingobium indicum]
MASETIFAYVGPKGSGKTHEGTRVVLEQLKLGRYVVAVIPTLDVGKVCELLDDESVRERLRVVDYDAVDQENFFPDEARIKLVKADDGSFVAGPDYHPKAWRESVVPCGAVVVIDEAWRWLESTKAIPERFKKALHMARHWRGPSDWRKQSDRDRYMDDVDLWHPALGGNPAKGGDGTRLISMNILLLTQDYSSLNRTLRKQIDQICDIKSYKKGAIPPVIQKIFPFWKTDGRYSVSTFEGHILPERRSKKYQEDRKSFEILPHRPEIHGLFEYAGGQAMERAVDDRSSASSDSRLSYIKYVALLTIAGIIVFGWWTYQGVNKMIGSAGSPAATADQTSPEGAETKSPALGPAAQNAVGRISAIAKSPVARVAGAIGGQVIVINSEGNLEPAPSDISFSERGPEGVVDGYQVSLWSAPLGASGGRRRELGVSGPGASLAGAAVKFADPDAVAASTAGRGG